MNLSRNLTSLALAPPQPPATVPAATLPSGRLTASVRRGLRAFGMNVTNRRDLAAAVRWLRSG
jgi:hypothetical protein